MTHTQFIKMVRLNEHISDKFINVSVGFWKDEFLQSCKNVPWNDPFQCNHKDIDIAKTYTKCIGIKSIIPVYYENDSFHSDLWPFPAALHAEVAEKYFASFPIAIGRYSFI